MAWLSEEVTFFSTNIFFTRTDLTQVLEYMFNIVEINCSFLVQGFEAVNINILNNIHYLESMD